MPDTRQIIEAFRQKGLDIKGVNASGNIDYTFLTPNPDEKLLKAAAKYKPQLVSYFSDPITKRTPSILDRMREKIREGNTALNSRLEPDATKHPILNALYPESATGKALMAVPATIGAATGLDESILAMMGIGAATGATTGALTGEGAISGGAQGLLSGLRLPGSKASEKVIATEYDKEVNQAVVDTLGHLPNTVAALTKSGKKWWDVLRTGEYSGMGRIAGKEAGDLYEKGMSNIRTKVANWADTQVEKVKSDWFAEHGFAINGKPPKEFEADVQFLQMRKAVLKKIQDFKRLPQEFQNTVQAISDSNKGIYQGASAEKADPIKLGKTPAMLLHEVDRMAEKTDKLLAGIGNATGEDLSGQFRQMKDQYSKFSALRDMAREVTGSTMKTVRPGDARVVTGKMMDFLNTEREIMESRLKDSWEPVYKAFLRHSDFSSGLDVEQGEGHLAGLGGRIPGVPGWIRVPAFLKKPAIRVGNLPQGVISKQTAQTGGALLGGEMGNVGRNAISKAASGLLGNGEEPVVTEP